MCKENPEKKSTSDFLFISSIDKLLFFKIHFSSFFSLRATLIFLEISATRLKKIPQVFQLKKI